MAAPGFNPNPSGPPYSAPPLNPVEPSGGQKRAREEESKAASPEEESPSQVHLGGEVNALAMSATMSEIRAQGVERELKRRRKEEAPPRSEMLMPHEAPPQAVAVEQTAAPPDASSILQALVNRAASCFGIKGDEVLQGKPLTLENLMEVCSAQADARFLTAVPVTEEEIQSMHQLFFETSLQDLSRAALAVDNPCNPSAAYVVHSLASCVRAIQARGTCREALEAFEAHLAAQPKPDPGVEMLLNLSSVERERIFAIFEESAEGRKSKGIFESFQQAFAQHRAAYSSLPVVPTRHLFETENVNHTFALHDSDGQVSWIFKPQELNGSIMCLREHTASLVNYHQAFPIPKTLLVSIGGWTGSAQLFVRGYEKREKIGNLARLVSPQDMQKVIIFDLLFGNCDRNKYNSLFRLEGRVYRVYAIDHDRCFNGPGEEMKQDYGEFSFLHQPFDMDILMELLSDGALTRYEEMMNLHKIPSEAIAWLRTAADQIIQGTEQRESISSLVESLQSQFLASF